METFAIEQFVGGEDRKIPLTAVWLIASLLRIQVHVTATVYVEDYEEQVELEFYNPKAKKGEGYVTLTMINLSTYTVSARNTTDWVSDQQIVNMNWAMIEEKLFDFRCTRLVHLDAA